MSQRPKKLQRVSKACDFCNRRSIKCSKGDDPLGRCQNCADFDVPCTFDRPIKRRGVKSSRAPANHTQNNSHDDKSPMSTGSRSQQDHILTSLSSRDPWESLTSLWSAIEEPSKDDSELRRSWCAFAIASARTVHNLVQVYFEIVYPIFPLFHRQSFIERLTRNEHLTNRGFFASTMAACALASGRARDGALYSKRWNLDELLEPPSEVFLAAAKDAIPKDLSMARGLDYMRACAILAITSIQNGQIKQMQQYSGYYHTLIAMEGLYDERLWPKMLSAIEVEERRRMFWSTYTLDIYTSIVWGGIIRHREAQSNVKYPTEIDDEYITDRGLLPNLPADTSPNGLPITLREPVSWLRGWNFTTDLYRILEHAVDALRSRSPQQNGITRFHSLLDRTQVTEAAVMAEVQPLYATLPPQFRETLPVTGEPAKDLFGFQSANIQATLQLLRMVVFTTEDNGIERKCDVAGELLGAFSQMPVEYLKAISSPLLHHLAGIGYILGSVMEGGLSEASYQRVRRLLLDMADLLSRLESSLRRAAGASERLRVQVDRIDEYMRQQRMLHDHQHHRQHQQHRQHSSSISTNQDSLQHLPYNQRQAGSYDESASHIQQTSPKIITPYAHDQQVTNHQLPQQQNQVPQMQPVSSIQYVQASNFGDPLSQIQLPPELLEDWPWPFDAGSTEGLLHMSFE